MFKFVLTVIFIVFSVMMGGYAVSAGTNLSIVLKVHDPDAFVKMGYDLFMLVVVSMWQITTVLLLIFGSLAPKPAYVPKVNLMNTLDEV